MDRIEKALLLGRTVGGKEGLNCIAELVPKAPVQTETSKAVASRPLEGVPVLVKDNIDVCGMHTTAGSLALSDNVAASDAPVVANLRRSGAVIIGKTNMTEFANFVTRGMPGGYSSRGGQVIHASDPALSPSGSSSGSAVAVAAGIVPMAVGTDTSFSIIACAKANGICGLKPPAGALSCDGIIPIAPTLDSAGPMAGNMADALKMYSAMRERPLGEIRAADTAGLRIAVNRANEDRVPEEEGRFLRRLAERLRSQGAEVSEIVQPSEDGGMMTIMHWEFKPMLERYLARSSASLKTLRDIVDYYEERPDTMLRYGDVFLRAALDETPGGLNGRPYLDALEGRRQAIVRVTREISAFDAVIMTGFTTVMHFCGLPSVTAAAAEKDAYGVRRSVILYGTDEYRLYAAALAVEREMKGDTP